MRPADVLRAALADQANGELWVCGKGEDGPRACALIALARQHHLRGFPLTVTTKAMGYMDTACGGSTVRFNDAPGRKWTEVEAKYREAIALALADEAAVPA